MCRVCCGTTQARYFCLIPSVIGNYSMRNILVCFNNETPFRTGYDLLINYHTRDKYICRNVNAINVGVDNSFNSDDFNEFKRIFKETAVKEVHANNIFNYYFQIYKNMYKDLIGRIHKNDNIVFVASGLNPTMYYSGIKEQAELPLFSLSSNFSLLIQERLKADGYKVLVNYGLPSLISKLQAARNLVIDVIIFLKLLISIFNINATPIGDKIGTFTIVRNMHQSRSVNKLRKIYPELEKIVFPSLFGDEASISDAKTLTKKSMINSLFKSWSKSYPTEYAGSYIHTAIYKLHYNSDNLSIRYYVRLLNKLLNCTKNDSRMLSLEQVSPQAYYDQEIFSNGDRCVAGLQTTLIERKQHYRLSYFNKFHMLNIDDYQYFKELEDSASYIGSYEYSYLTGLRITSCNKDSKINNVIILTQPYSVEKSVQHFDAAIDSIRKSKRFSTSTIEVILHPRDNEQQYECLKEKYKVKIEKSCDKLYEKMSVSGLIVTRTSSLINDAIVLNIPTVAINIEDEDRKLETGYLNKVKRLCSEEELISNNWDEIPYPKSYDSSDVLEFNLNEIF